MANYKKLDYIKNKEIGSYEIKAIVKKIKQTKGPTLFELEDGTTTLTCAAFSSPGKRTFPEIQEGMYVEATIQIESRDERKNFSIKEIFEMTEASKKTFEEALNKEKDILAETEEKLLIVNTNNMQKLKPLIKKIAFEIRKAVINKQPIILKHHADADGYISALALEESIKGFMFKIYKEVDEFLISKNPMKSPFYSYSDALKDISNINKTKERFNSKSPLVVILDNGSTDEDILALKRLNIHSIKTIVIDHHKPSKEVDDYLYLHLNPYNLGLDKNISTGLMAVEIANLIHHLKNPVTYAAISLIADKSEGEEVDFILNKVKKEEIETLAACIDYDAYNLGTISETNIISTLLENKEFIEELNKEIKNKFNILMARFKKYGTITTKNKIKILEFDTDLYTGQFDYPPQGKATGVIFREYGNKQTVALGYGSDSVSIRISEELEGITVFSIKEHLIKKFPEGNIEGGGHEKAGTIKFLKGLKEDIINEIKNYIMNY